MSLNVIEKLYYEMARIRMIEEKISAVYKDQEIRCPVHLSIGQEACAVGVCQALEKEDQVLSGHRNHAHYLAKGGDLKSMISELYGKETGCCRGKGGSMHLTDRQAGFVASTPIVGSTIPIAVGNSLAHKLSKNNRVTTIFFGDGAVETGVFYESLNIAACMELGVIFVCENNFYSVYSPLSVRQPKNREICKTASALGIKTSVFEGTNVQNIYNEMKNIVSTVRKTMQPYFVLINTYRYKEHCGPGEDDNLGYRSTDEVETWKKLDPLINIKKKISPNIIKEIENEIKKEIEEAFLYAINSSFPKQEESKSNVLAI